MRGCTVHGFFPWYNTEHHHSGLGLLTPADVHHGGRRSVSPREPRCSPPPMPLTRNDSPLAGPTRPRVLGKSGSILHAPGTLADVIGPAATSTC
jgi:hypothetical protein